MIKHRILGKTGWNITEVSLGTWQVGGKWGNGFDDKNAEEILHKSIDLGVNFIDTADVYEDGLSEAAVARVVKSRSEEVYIATKCGRQLNPHTAEAYNPKNIRKFVDQSLQNTGLDKLDLIQLHCPPTAVFQKDDVFESLDQLKAEGKIRHYGVSVEKVEEAMMAIKYPGVASVQIIFNMFRLKPTEAFFAAAKAANVGILARVPLASGLLAGKFHKQTTFSSGDHRNFNRNGEAFDKGETFSGIDYDKGLDAVEVLKNLFHAQEDLYAYALKWVLMFDAVSCVIPGASKMSQAINNVKAADLPDFTPKQMKAVEDVYDKYFREDIHHLW